MDIAVLTFPGHVLQTTLSLRSIIHKAQPKQIFILIDDYSSQGWSNYVDDFKTWIMGDIYNVFPIYQRPNIVFKHYSDLALDRCSSGWWRAQLIKLYSDEILSVDKVFLVDGDIIFDRLPDLEKLEDVIPYTRRTPGQNSTVAVLHQNYVKRLLEIPQGSLTVNQEYVATSPVPFRVVTKQTLKSLRHHVEELHKKNFLELHLDWFEDQTIIGYEETPTRMIMTEWELIECYRQYLTNQNLSFLDVGSGYSINQNTERCIEPVVYKHSYQRDYFIGREWFESQLGALPDRLWADIEHWTQTTQGI